MMCSKFGVMISQNPQILQIVWSKVARANICNHRGDCKSLPIVKFGTFVSSVDYCCLCNRAWGIKYVCNCRVHYLIRRPREVQSCVFPDTPSACCHISPLLALVRFALITIWLLRFFECCSRAKLVCNIDSSSATVV